MKWAKFEKEADPVVVSAVREAIKADIEKIISIKVAKKITGHKRNKKGRVVVKEKEGIRVMVAKPELKGENIETKYDYEWIFDKELVKLVKDEIKKIQREEEE